MENRELICIRCPLGCMLSVDIDEDNIKVSGNTCKRGEEYGKVEVVNPTRMVTSSVRVSGGDLCRVPVKTETDIPKDKIFECMEEIRKAQVEAPVKIGDIIIKNCAGTGVDIVATRNIMEA